MLTEAQRTALVADILANQDTADKYAIGDGQKDILGIYQREPSKVIQAISFDWIPNIGVSYFFGVDGISTLLILLTTLLGMLATANVGWLFVATAVGYFLTYEWLHWAYHQPPTTRIGRLRVVRRLRRHHLVHHDPHRMTKVNFNITFPIGDRLFGTSDSTP